MSGKDLHDKPFDESTIAKLKIFEEYTRAWLPTFSHTPNRTICIFDFFAGTGYDTNGNPGSPIRILQVINTFIDLLFKNRITVKVYLNEYKHEKYYLLIEACHQYLRDHIELNGIVKIEFFNNDFDVIYTKLYPLIDKFPSLVFLDQNGVKFASDRYFASLEKLKETDFLFFISSSFFLRFGNTKEFQNHFPIDINVLRSNPYRFIHQEVVSVLKSKIPASSKLKLYPFTLLKGTNIYGLVFGAKHHIAVNKFLNVVWKMNPINGIANFDIDQETPIKELQLSLFPTKPKQTKIEKFQGLLTDKIKLATSISNLDLYSFTLEQGHIAAHARDYLKTLKRLGKIHFEGSEPKVSSKAFSNSDETTITWIAK